MPVSRSVRRRSASSRRIAGHRVRRAPAAISPRPHSFLTCALPRQATLRRVSRAMAGDERGREMRTRKRRLGMGVVLGAALAAAGVAVIAPTAVAQREPGKDKAKRPADRHEAAAARELHRQLHVQPSQHRRPDRVREHARRVARPQLRRQQDDERVLDGRLAARRQHDMPSFGRDGRVLDADALRRRQRRRSDRSDDLLPAQDAAAGARDAAGLQDDRRRREGGRRRSAGR